jgi:hypothetical protein
VNNKIVLFTHVPKCAGVSVESYLEKVVGSLSFRDNAYLSHEASTVWNKSSPQHVDGLSMSRLFPDSKFFDHYFSVVRHPIKRVVSAYKFQKYVEKSIASNMKINDFFLRLKAEDINSIGFCDNHFMPMHRFFVPLNGFKYKLFKRVKYKVFKLEEGLQEVKNWLETEVFDSQTNIQIGHENSMDKFDLSSEDFTLNAEAIYHLNELYKQDFELFQYSPSHDP